MVLLPIYTVFQKSDAKIQITITKAYLIRISGFNYRLSDVNVANPHPMDFAHEIASWLCQIYSTHLS